MLGNLFTVLLILAYRSRYPKDMTSSVFIGGKGLQLALLVVLMQRDFIPFEWMLPVVILLSISSGMVESLALLLLLDASSPVIQKRYYLWVGSAAVLLLFLHVAFGQGRLLSAGPAVISAISLLYPTYRLAVKSKDSPLQKMMGLLYSIAIVALGCGAFTILYPENLLSAQAEQGLQMFFRMGIYLLMFLGTAGFMLLSREQSYAELERVATYDELTGILNRRSFVLRAHRLIAAAAKEVTPFSFLLMDIDHFKSVNDTYGHDTGDKVLKDFAVKIVQQLRDEDIFGRFGGEEFAVLLQRADEAASDEIAERLRTSVSGAVINGVWLDYSVSIGIISVRSSERISLNALYKLTDTALYQAKQSGRNRVVRSQGNSTHPDIS
ncbi:GGDEF domain-containing protein [Paenibacillus sp. NPDC057934]|uniref:GGDEF domain-containing protein n=1 Tax=Paenibacillus sp. NPDC057934 TaxID=3346282 RepID=UPI0036DBBEE0